MAPRSLVLPPIVGPFPAAHPGITLEVTGDDSVIDVLAAGFAAGVRCEEWLERDMITVPTGPRRQRFAAAASAGYLWARGLPARPEDLLGHACIRHRFTSGAMPAMEFERGRPGDPGDAGRAADHERPRRRARRGAGRRRNHLWLRGHGGAGAGQWISSGVRDPARKPPSDLPPEL